MTTDLTHLSDDALVERAFDAQRTLSRAIHALSAPEWETIDLTMPQMKALMILDTDGPLAVGELACRMRFAKPATSILVEKMVQGGYLARTEDPTDRRRTILHVSPKGADLVAALLRGTHTQLRAYLSRMDHADLVALVQGLSVLTDMIKDDLPLVDPCAATADLAEIAAAKPATRTPLAR